MGRKHWEKEKLLITSNFSFFHSVFKRLVLQTGENKGLFGRGSIMHLHEPWYQASHQIIIDPQNRFCLKADWIFYDIHKIYQKKKSFGPGQSTWTAQTGVSQNFFSKIYLPSLSQSKVHLYHNPFPDDKF